VKFLTPKIVVPYHYNTWPLIQQDVHAWTDRVNSETKSEAVVLEVEQLLPVP
jgi:L-ascorbate metabolism protein UlaG (beta-lactamase superfamily)